MEVEEKNSMFNNTFLNWCVIQIFILCIPAGFAKDIRSPEYTTVSECRSGLESSCVAIGDNHLLTIDTMGNVWASGNNDYGQLGLGTSNPSVVTQPVKIPNLNDIVKVYANGDSSYAINGSGAMFAWGQNDKCQLGTGNKRNQYYPVATFTIGLDPKANIWHRQSSGAKHKLEIDESGKLWASGDNNKGQLGQGNKLPYAQPVQVMKSLDFKKVYAVDDSSFAITVDGKLYVWGKSRYPYKGFGQRYKNPLLTPTHLAGVGKIQIIDIWNQKDKVPNTLYLPLNSKNAISKFDVSADGREVYKADGSVWVWGHSSGSCYPRMKNRGSDFIADVGVNSKITDVKIKENHSKNFNKTVKDAIHDDDIVAASNALVEKTLVRLPSGLDIALEITNPAPYLGEPITLKARVRYNTFRNVWLKIDSEDQQKCTLPNFSTEEQGNECVSNNFINMASLLREPKKPDRIEDFVSKYQQTEVLMRYREPNKTGTIEVSACGTTIDTDEKDKGKNKEVCSPVRKITVSNLVCSDTEYEWSVYNPGKWALTEKEINDIFQLDDKGDNGKWDLADTKEITDGDLTKGIVNFLGRNLAKLTNQISLDKGNVIRAVNTGSKIKWLPDGQTFLWNPVHRAWITIKETKQSKLCVTHVSKEPNLNFRADKRSSESVFTDGFAIPAFRTLSEGKPAQSITASPIYHVVVAGKRLHTLYISTSSNFKWTYWIAGHKLGRGGEKPYNMYVIYTWNGLVSKESTTRADQAEITVPHQIPSHNIIGVYEIDETKDNEFKIKSFSLNKSFYPQKIDLIH